MHNVSALRIIASSLALVLAAALSALGCGPKPFAAVTPTAAPPADPRAQMVSDLAQLRFDRLGNPVLRWDSIPPVIAPRDNPHQLLVLLVEYADRDFDRFRGDPAQGAKLASWYQAQLFDDTYQKIDTLSHYYHSQSMGAYHVTGRVLPPIKLAGSRASYGAPHRPAGGSWRNDAEPEGMVEEALARAVSAYPDLRWDDYDRWDPKDVDGDGVINEPDGYLDHFVLVFAGGGQASCQLLHQIDSYLTPNVGAEALASLEPKQRECAERMWPHRSNVARREGKGPRRGGVINRLGGVPVSPTLWIRDYNMQSEYIGAETFIHEFGHSIGLPDVYSRTSSNSTGPWEVMSATTSPSPQNLSAWSRIQLGWLTPTIIMPPAHGGASEATITLRTLDDPAGDGADHRAALVVLPPKTVDIELTALPPSGGARALYSGQGNDLNRTAELRVDLSGHRGPVELAFDAWWEIEGGWDFVYVETSTDGELWTRRVPVGREHMPAKHGHDGKETVPGFTGLSGDIDGDGKNEGSAGCDPSQELAHGDDQASAARSPCLIPTWVRPRFDLSDLAGAKARVRLRYYTDGAAVMRGFLVDNLAMTGAPAADFEAALADAGDGDGWHIDGFSPSTGAHELLVPHFYVLEYRDPYAAKRPGHHRYDAALDEAQYRFYRDPAAADAMRAVLARPRPGVLAWYYNGSFAWSENDPATNGPGQGYLLAIDSDPSEIPLPGLDGWFRGTAAGLDSHYDVSAADAQAALRAAYFATVCWLRSPDFMPRGGVPAELAGPACGAGRPPLERVRMNGQRLMYSYEVQNRYLPGPERDALSRAGELYDVRIRGEETSYRLRDRTLRHLHTLDAPFSAEPFADGVVHYQADARLSGAGGPVELTRISASAYPANPRFSDAEPGRWLNPKLPFGGVAVPSEGFSFEVQAPGAADPSGTRARVIIQWATR